MSEQLFTEYKHDVARQCESMFGFVANDEQTPDALRVLRRCHSNNMPANHAAHVVYAVFAPPERWPEVEQEEHIGLTEAGEAALEMNDELKAIDSSLGLPPSSPSSAPPPPVDPCDDDVVKPDRMRPLEKPVYLEDRPVDATHKQRKVPRR